MSLLRAFVEDPPAGFCDAVGEVAADFGGERKHNRAGLRPSGAT